MRCFSFETKMATLNPIFDEIYSNTAFFRFNIDVVGNIRPPPLLRRLIGYTKNVP